MRPEHWLAEATHIRPLLAALQQVPPLQSADPVHGPDALTSLAASVAELASTEASGAPGVPPELPARPLEPLAPPVSAAPPPPWILPAFPPMPPVWLTTLAPPPPVPPPDPVPVAASEAGVPPAVESSLPQATHAKRSGSQMLAGRMPLSLLRHHVDEDLHRLVARLVEEVIGAGILLKGKWADMRGAR